MSTSQKRARTVPIQRTGDESPRILVVDDDEAIRNLLLEALSAEGYDVRAAADGFEALAELRRWCPDIVVTDLLLPKLHGWDLTAACLAQRGRRPKLVAMSAAGPLALRLAREAGADEALAKPFALQDVLDAVESLAQPRAA